MRCIALIPISTYISHPKRCEKPARVKIGDRWVCRHHEAKARRGDLGIWTRSLGRALMEVR